MRKRLWLLPSVILLVLGGLVFASSFHTITVDGKVTDFTSDEELTPDPGNDSLFGPNNELEHLYVTWDASQLYLGMSIKALGSAPMILVDLETSVGATSFCPTAGYLGAFPANFITPTSGSDQANIDLLFAGWVTDSTSSTTCPITPFVYKLTAKNSSELKVGTDLTQAPKADCQYNATSKAYLGAMEAGIPWNTLFGLGAGKVPACAKIRIGAVIRGKTDGSALGDAHPNVTTMGDISHDCWTGSSKISIVDKLLTVTIDKNCDGVPEKGWMPGTDKPTPDAGVDAKPIPDQKPKADQTPVVKDKGQTPDQPTKKDGIWQKDLAKMDKTLPKADQQVKKDIGVKADQQIKKDIGVKADQALKLDSKQNLDIPGKLDQKVAVDKTPGHQDTSSHKDLIAADLEADSGQVKPPGNDEGCACSAHGDQSFSLLGMTLMGLLALVLIPRRKR